MAVIIPCAGQSSRYPGTRPKYLLTVSNGECLFERAANLYVDCTDVHFVILREHAEKYDAEIAINKVYGHRDNVHIHILDQPTSGPAETSYHVAMKLSDTPIFIQDCDSFFTSSLSEENYVCTVNLKDNLDVINVAAKSFAVTNEQGLLTNIVEKSVVSNQICVGGYGFKSADTFCRSFERLSEIHEGEIFVSHIIKELLQTNVFVAKDVQDYVDLGTYKEFVEYNKQRQTIFCDIDGTVFYNQSKLFSNDYSNPPRPIPGAVMYLLQKQEKGATIIFTTSRPSKFKDTTEKGLEDCGFKDIRVLYDIPHAPRVLINDTSITNPYPSATSINVPRDDNEYWSKMI